MNAIGLLAAVLISAISASAISISDDFNDGTIDASIWNVSKPFGHSDVFEASGAAVLIARGGLQTIEEVPNAIEITGRFKLTHSLDNIKVAFRTDLSTTSPFAELSGLIVEFNAGGGTFIAPGGGSASSVIGSPMSTYAASIGSFHDFRILDDGLNVSVFLDGATSPVTWGTISHRTGNKVAFYNREFDGLRAELDFVTIVGVPDDSWNFGMLVGSMAFLVFFKSRRIPNGPNRPRA